MKSKKLRRPLASLAALLTLTGIAEAHPGHFPLDWFYAAHTDGYASALLTVGIIFAFWGACRFAARKI